MLTYIYLHLFLIYHAIKYINIFFFLIFFKVGSGFGYFSAEPDLRGKIPDPHDWL